ncbi:MAG: amino acid transporter [Proteobacteria bacterium]|nr:amino acid transporter [Pseudomonadota bacterium]
MAAPAAEPPWQDPALDAWSAWRPQEVARRLAGCGAAWCVAGGWAIDLWLGEETRPHEDLEIAVPEGEFPLVRARLEGLDLYNVGSGKVARLAAGETPWAGSHQTWVREPEGGAWRLDVFREPGDVATWAYRRDAALTAPRAQMVGEADGIPFLKPQGVLLFKAKARRDKDQADFDACLPRMDAGARAWLRAGLERFQPDSPWIGALG